MDDALDRITQAVETERGEGTRTCPHCQGPTQITAEEDAGIVHVSVGCRSCPADSSD